MLSFEALTKDNTIPVFSLVARVNSLRESGEDRTPPDQGS